jgi:hypothetical protein
LLYGHAPCEKLLLEQAHDSCKILSESEMKRITLWRMALFIGVLAVVALVVYLPRYRREQQQVQAVLQQPRNAQNEVEAPGAAGNAATQHTQYLSQYLNRGFDRQPGFKAVAIAAEFQTGESDRPIAEALARRLEGENLVLFTSFFKPAFYADGLFSNILAGSTAPIYNLELTNKLDALLLAQERVQYSTNGNESDHVITANARLEVAFLPFGVMRREQSWTFAADGAGFNSGEARSNAEARLLKQIAADTNISLLSLPSENQESYP